MTDALAWKRLRSRLLLDRSPWLRVFADDVELPDGRQVDGYLRVDGRDFAMVFALTDDGDVPFVRQYKYGLDAFPLQLPAGYLEDGEAPEACARRELLEETGFEASEWLSLGSYAADGNRRYATGHLFLARHARPAQAAAAGDLGEVHLEVLPLETLDGVLSSGQLQELSAIACVALALNRLRRSPAGSKTTHPGAR
jgi:ADP-ribose pyrophosphatase